LRSGKQADAQTQTGLDAKDQASALANSQTSSQVAAQSNIQSGIQASTQLANQADAVDAKAGRQSTNAKAAATIAASVSDASDTATAIKPTHQDLYQQLVAQTAPMVAITAGQRYEKDSDVTQTDGTTAPADSVAVSNVATQASGTQLATDAQAVDSATRHQLRSAVGSHQWATELGNKLTMMATKDTQSATLHMSPADLGPVQVRIDMNQNQASVWFTAEHADTRSALEQSLPRLREMFASQGMSLTDAGVFNGQPRQQANYSSPEQGSSSALRFAGDEASETISSARGISLSLLDAYA
jgi:flagellar hook-length control protein FliK